MNSPRRQLFKAFSFFLFLALAVLLLRNVEADTEFFSRFVDGHIRSSGFLGVLLYVGLAGLLVCFGIPRQLLSFAGGYAFGAVWGFVWATTGVTLGCVLSFNYARFLGQGLVQRKFGRRIGRLERFLQRDPFSAALVIRCLPVGNNLVTNILAGLSRIPALPFVAGSCLGYMPQNFIFSLLGSGITVGSSSRLLVSAALFVLAAILGLRLYRSYGREIQD